MGCLGRLDEQALIGSGRRSIKNAAMKKPAYPLAVDAFSDVPSRIAN